MSAIDLSGPIVLDVGSGTTKAGWAGNATPHTEVPTVAARRRHQRKPTTKENDSSQTDRVRGDRPASRTGTSTDPSTPSAALRSCWAAGGAVAEEGESGLGEAVSQTVCATVRVSQSVWRAVSESP
eukprot:Selendium_serpulae@DN5886_c0_g2_i3.p1